MKAGQLKRGSGIGGLPKQAIEVVTTRRLLPLRVGGQGRVEVSGTEELRLVR